VVVAAADTAVRLRVTSVVSRIGVSSPWSGESLAVPTPAIASVAQRHLSRGRSWLAAGGVAAATILAAVAFDLIGGGGSRPGNGGGGGPR
jgi:hypothetical protein